MAPRRGETMKDRREGETTELGERISNVEAKISKLETVLEEKLEAMGEAIRQLTEALARVQIQLEKGKEANPNLNPENLPVEEGDSLVGGASQTQFPNGEMLGQPRITGGGGMMGQVGRPQGRNPRPAAPWVEAGQGGFGQQGPTLGWTVDTAEGGQERFYASQHGRSNGGHPRPAASGWGTIRRRPTTMEELWGDTSAIWAAIRVTLRQMMDYMDRQEEEGSRMVSGESKRGPITAVPGVAEGEQDKPEGHSTMAHGVMGGIQRGRRGGSGS